jgi:hypothetical protein
MRRSSICVTAGGNLTDDEVNILGDRPEPCPTPNGPCCASPAAPAAATGKISGYTLYTIPFGTFVPEKNDFEHSFFFRRNVRYVCR